MTSFIRGGETVTIKSRTEASTDDYGNPTYVTTSRVVKDALLGIGGTSEPVDAQRDATDASVTLYLPAGTLVLEGDQFVIRGSYWERAGEALEWVSPFSNFEAGVVVPLRRKRG
jgi:hypothetical protein